MYAISGLGADYRVFEYLEIDADVVAIDWITPKNHESIESYSLRLSSVIDTDEPFGIMGVSFGGLIAVEISKILNPKFTIIISSAKTKKELRKSIRLLGKTNIIKWIPIKLFNPPKKIAQYLFGAKNIALLNQILDDTDLVFAKWAVSELSMWKNEVEINNLLKISGTHDKLIPATQNDNAVLIEEGAHFMIVDLADEINLVINEFLVRLYGL